MIRIQRVLAASLALATLFACSEPEPAATPPKTVRPVTSTTLTGTVGQAVPGGVTVYIIDYSDRPMEDVKVAFSIIGGDGSISSQLVLTNGEGLAHVEWTLGQTAGTNEVVASIFGIDSTAHFVATANPAAASGLSITPRVVRIPSSSTAGSLAGRVVDQFGNPLSGTVTYTSRNPAIVTVNSS